MAACSSKMMAHFNARLQTLNPMSLFRRSLSVQPKQPIFFQSKNSSNNGLMYTCDKDDVVEGKKQSSSVTRGPFVDAFLMKMIGKGEKLNNKKIWSRRSTILPEFVGSYVRIYNGKTHVKCKITEGKVDRKFGEFAFTRKRRPQKDHAAPVKKKAKK
ncbi:Ribosomal protein S19 [Heracleum sosnowskyi]|uniref:Ribosomal protein S19 n=1 Tax=Heracleum sosnowskyi TaxID=360622 RepID=A0AAD8IDQ6_9APIA|nr:Ribosomal protein S19 [Heracleum sosnowskyi]KAK1383288.1 Ribosomal protein S19 [Heracleum sosnowskyi]